MHPWTTELSPPDPERDAERLRVLAEATSHVVVIHDHGRVVDCNDRFCEMIGCTFEQSVGIDLLEHFHPVEGERVIGLSMPDATVTQRVIATLPDGRTRELEGTGRPIVYRGRHCRVVSLLDVTDRVEAERAVRESERVMREMLENLPLITVEVDIEGRIVMCNDALSAASGYTREQLLGSRWESLLTVDDPEQSRELERRRRAGETPPHQELILVTRSGDHRRVAWCNTTVRDTDGRVAGAMSIGEDITDRRQAEIAAAGRARQQEAVARIGADALTMTVQELLDEVVREVASALGAPLVSVLLGGGENETLLTAAAVGWRRGLIGRHRVYARPGSLAHRVLSARTPIVVDDLSESPDTTGAATLREGAVSAMGAPIHGIAGGSLQGLLMVHSHERAAFSGDDAHFLYAVANVLGTAIERDRAQTRLQELAYLDQLTGLPNRAMLHERLDTLIGLAGQHGRAVAVLWVDVDNFQLVNDSFGQRAGDSVIAQVGDTLSRAARGADLVARHAGDEFLVVIGDGSDGPVGGGCSNVEDVAQIAQVMAGRVRAAFRTPFSAEGADVFLRPCIGVAVLPVHAEDRDGLLRHADIAKNQAKLALRTGSAGALNALDPLHEISLTARLHRAIEQDEFLLHYQPVVDIASGDLLGVEALVRWRDRDGSLIPPSEFIPLAERVGVIGPLTDWVVEEACRQAAAWHAAGLEIAVAVNVPAILWQPDAADRLIATVTRHGIAPDLFTVEVTESTAMADPAGSDGVLERLGTAGLHLAIDDFGTGYSSLSRLRELPASTLKIDRSFVRELGSDPAADAMVETIVGLARNLGLRPLAEGIETEQQRHILLAHGCRIGQGYLFSRPRPADEITPSCALRRAA
jgi:diguanylate cyclase (GGDEF)-like protein/PAS domain S-box-containing protein